MMKDIIIAIDGYSSCGKSSLAREIARDLGYIYIDTGAMYRAVTLFCLQNRLIKNEIFDQKKLKELLPGIDIGFRYNSSTGCNETYLNGVNIENEIRMPEVASHVSPLSALPFVRERMVALQKEMGKNKRIVMDGRDIGTVVFPDAEVKIFMTADPEVRARRRLAELEEKNIKTTLGEVLANLKERDFMDENRETSPLRKAGDAYVIDNTSLTRIGQLEEALSYIKKKMNGS
jgi:CMP/dCMP kinase